MSTYSTCLCMKQTKFIQNNHPTIHITPEPLYEMVHYKTVLWFTISVIVYLCMYIGMINFILDSRLANFWERNCPFGFLLVVF